MNPIHPLSVPVPPPVTRKPVCRPSSARKARRRRKARLRCRLNAEERAELTKQHWRAVLGFACRYGVLNPGVVADIAMKETLRVFRKRKGKFKPLLFKILRWRLASAYRQESRQRLRCVPLSHECDAIIERDAVLDELDEVKSVFLSAWRELEPLDQQLLHLHYVQGCTFPEIQGSRAFRIKAWKEASLRSKAHRAMLKLRARLQSFREVPESVWLLVLQSIPVTGIAFPTNASRSKSAGHVRRNTTTRPSGYNS